ncbi:Targeting complex (TRAPP) subunit [Phytophthora cinnamomi]|uniref:Targeting complex (TRAPP) subunit n=1 Tax=Phytophthora cinnamomi TaxID=4785 RepID=UPI00355A5376|nr:Targeting complex (TRAPP) subunit [Phytophthora cinnamomi]
MRRSSPAPPRWTRPAQFLVYLVPVGGIPPDVFAGYAGLLQRHGGELPLRSLTRPGGYAAELSPFRGLDWAGAGALRFRFVSTAERVDACDGEDAHASRRVAGVLGVCHSPSLTLSGGLRAAHAQFEASVRRFPGLLLHKLFAFEHAFEDATAAECEGLGDLVMFPVHHELQGTGESTVSLHLQVVMDTLAVNALMALESAIRSATSSAAAATPRAASGGDLASVLLDVNVEPQQTHAMQQQQQSVSSPVLLSRDAATFGSAASPTLRSSGATGPSFTSIPSPLAAGVAALDPRNRRRKRQLARREKLLGDYSVLVSCISDAMDHYTVAVEMLREEERRSGGAPGDALWLAAALEGHVFCLYSEAQDKFSTELVEKASEAVALYAKAGTVELESLLIENLGWYYAAVSTATLRRSSMAGEAKVLESLWTKRLLWDVLERGLVLFPELQSQRQQALKSDFFYSPFEKQKMMRKAAQRGGNEEDAVDDAPAMYERGFPVHERIELQLTLSNPTGAAVKLQQVKAWVTFVEEESGADAMDTNALLRDDAVESYPSFLTLGPYEKRKTVMLGVQPLRVGTFHVRGCFIKAFNITTSFTLKDPVTIRVVGELPMVSLSLREHGSMALSEGEKAVATKLSPASNMRIVMFATETKRCMVRVRSTGNQQITHYRLAVNVQHRRAAKKTCVIFNNLPPASADTVSATVHTPANPKTSSGQVETQALSLRCSKIVSSPLPLCSGDFVSIPFEVFLRGKKDPGEPLEDDIQIEWSFVYADESCSGEVYYRESKLSLELISLPSLMLRSVALLPCSVEQIPAEKIDRTLCDSDALSTTDHLYCAIMVHIVNPTETTFRFRLHRDMDGSGEAICEAEIGRQCSRRFVVEVPRFPALDEEQGPTKLTDMLNDLLEMEWDTYFGTQGRLRCEEYHLGPIAEQDEMQRELVLPPVSFQIHSPIEAPTSLVGGKPQNGDIIEMKQGRHGTVALHPLNFFQATHLRAESRTLHAALFQYVPIDVTIQRTFNTGDGEQQVSGVELEVVITEEGNERVFEVSEHVVVVGLLKTQVTWSGPTEEAVKNHEVQFTSEYFQIRKLLWDELKLNVRASEEGELRSAIGSHLIEGNEDLRQELAVLVEILTEFQQQNDDIRDALARRPHIPEPPGRPLLIEKLKLLAADMHGPSRQVAIRSAKDSEVLDYVLSTSDTFNPSSYQAPMTPKMEGVSPRSISNDPVDGVALRPGTATGWRPTTSGSQRPVSRGSTISVSSIAAVLDSPEVHHRLNLDEIDAIKEDLREALNDEHQLLLEDIDFIQGCLEMEKDLIDDDRRKVTAVKPPPSLSDLHDLRKTLEKTLEDQEAVGQMESILSKATKPSSFVRSRIFMPVPPMEPPSSAPQSRGVSR